LNLRPLGPEPSALAAERTDALQVTSTPLLACTAACTSEAETNERRLPQVDPNLARVIEVWSTLPEAIRRAIVAIADTALPATE